MAWYRIAENVLDAIANAINAKTGKTAPMTPVEMVSEIQSIPVGSGDNIVLLASGSHTLATDTSSEMNIPISVSGTIREYFVVADNTVADVNRTYAWCGFPVLKTNDAQTVFPTGCYIGKTKSSAGLEANVLPRATSISNSNITCQVGNTTNVIRAGTYSWYVWGIQE